MEIATDYQNSRFFTRRGAFAGVIATLAMDCLSTIAHRLGVTAPIPMDLIGRWFASIVRLQPFHQNIAKSPAVRNEVAIAVAGHYAIGWMLACLFIWVMTRSGRPLRQFHSALVYGVYTNALPWLIMFPAMGYGFFGARGPSGTTLFFSSLCSHAFYGLGLGIAMYVITAKAIDGYAQLDFKVEGAQ